MEKGESVPAIGWVGALVGLKTPLPVITVENLVPNGLYSSVWLHRCTMGKTGYTSSIFIIVNDNLPRIAIKAASLMSVQFCSSHTKLFSQTNEWMIQVTSGTR